jgi:hypothetical protein
MAVAQSMQDVFPRAPRPSRYGASSHLCGDLPMNAGGSHASDSTSSKLERNLFAIPDSLAVTYTGRIAGSPPVARAEGRHRRSPREQRC